MTRFLSVCLLAASLTPKSEAPRTPDPVVADGDKYSVLLENETVRVLRYHDLPGAKTHLHHHPNFVMYALAPFRRQLTLGGEAPRVREFKAGDVAWMPAQSHVGENIGTTPTDVLLIELKSGSPR